MTSYATEIIPGLFVGDKESCIRSINRFRISLVISMIDDSPAEQLPYIRLIKNPVHDFFTQDMSYSFQKLVPEIKHALARKERVLVHCYAGKSRAPTIVTAYLIRHVYPCSVVEPESRFEHAYNHIRAMRPIISINMGFMEQLRRYAEKCR